MKRWVALLFGVTLIVFAVRYFGAIPGKAPDSKTLTADPVQGEGEAPVHRTSSIILSNVKMSPLPVKDVPSSSPESATDTQNGETPSKARIVNLAPTLEEYRADAAKNPHTPSQALLRFAADLAPKFDEALQSPEKASAFLDELSECLMNEKVRQLLPVQAVCLANVRRLGQKLPSLESRAKEVWDRADPKLKKLVP